MKRSIYFSFLLFIAFVGGLKGQKDNPASLTGIYQSFIDPSVEFIVKKSGEQLMLEIPGQGQANMRSNGDGRFYFREVPITLQFYNKDSGKVTGFLLTQKKGAPAEWTRLRGEIKNAFTGKYRLKNNPYKSIYVSGQYGSLTARVNEGPSLPLIDSAGKFRVKAGDYTIEYEFIKDKEGQITKVVTREGGTIQFLRVKDYDVAYDGGFVRPNGFTHADTLRGTLSPLRACYDVNFYALDVEVFPYKKFIKGHNNIHFKVVSSFDRIQVDLYENMKIEKILYHARELPYTREHNAIFIQFPNPITEGSRDSIDIYYEGKPITPNIAELKSGFFWYQDRDGYPWIESVCQGSGASLWWPCKDHLSDEPDSMKISVTVPGDLTEISNGRLLHTSSLPGNRKKFD